MSQPTRDDAPSDDAVVQGVRISTARGARLVAVIHWAKFRTLWIYLAIIPLVVGVAIMWVRHLLMGDDPGAQRFVAGALVLAIVYSSFEGTVEEAVPSRERGEYAWFRYLGLRPASVLVAGTIPPLLSAIPSTLAVIGAGVLLFDTSVRSPAAVLGVVALVAIVASQAALCVALWLDMRKALITSKLVPLALVAFTPMIVTGSRAPGWMSTVGRASPTTAAVELLEGQALRSDTVISSGRLLADVAVLVLSALILACVNARLLRREQVV